LQVADLDNDGDLDVVAAEMHTSRKKRILVYFNEGGAFRPVRLSGKGSHNMRVGDIGNDGDMDIVGKNYAGKGRVIEMWENLVSPESKWEYVSVDRDRPKSQRGKMGLCFGDADGDGFPDIMAGSMLYLNPKGDLRGDWQRIDLPAGLDVFFAVDVDGDRSFDLIGIEGNTVNWMEAVDESAQTWKARGVGTVAAGGRTQGYVRASFLPGDKPQLVFTRGRNLYVLEIPANPEEVPWPIHLISTECEEEGVAVGDIDGDGDPDIAATHADGGHVVWLENPGSLKGPWKMRVAGEGRPWMDRVALADLNGDGRPDIVATEERQDWKPDALIYWFEAPADPKTEEWKRHIVARHRSINSMDVADFDEDGRMDIVVAEHTDQKSDGAQDNLTVIYLNRDGGRDWLPHVVERGPHSSHLGARVVDLDKDGVPEIVSIGWSQYRRVHLWKKVSHGWRPKVQ
jgi:hypothetical protein